MYDLLFPGPQVGAEPTASTRSATLKPNEKEDRAGGLVLHPAVAYALGASFIFVTFIGITCSVAHCQKSKLPQDSMISEPFDEIEGGNSTDYPYHSPKIVYLDS